MDVLTEQIFEEHCLISYRAIMDNAGLEENAKKIESYANEQGATCIKYPITTIYGVDTKSSKNKYDTEIYIPIDKAIKGNQLFIYKPVIRIVNALKIVHKGDISGLQKTCDKLNEFIINNRLIPITSGYNVTINKDEVAVYVGINPNVL